MTQLTCIVRFKKLRIPLQTKPLIRYCFTEKDRPSHRFSQPFATTCHNRIRIPRQTDAHIFCILICSVVSSTHGPDSLNCRKEVLDSSNPSSSRKCRRPFTRRPIQSVKKSNVPSRILYLSPGLSYHPRIYCTLVGRTGCRVSHRYFDTIRAQHHFTIPSIQHTKLVPVHEWRLAKSLLRARGHPMSISVSFFPCTVREISARDSHIVYPSWGLSQFT
ncbi:hypothetical protein OG21DRAFT_632897 [Imleria badia]|nr:hypothetical protein OG21DRAFT_632897 [Imleria badia]